MYKIFVDENEFICGSNEDLITAHRKVMGSAIPFGCRGGGCGMCKIEVIEGDYTLGTSSMAVLPQEERELKYALACKTYPKGELKIRVVGK
ncbi:2Fe-2S iron-sulfur cluster-binding protein [Bacillus sp. Marseille-P3661]|uniref:2Fe-2S iron-sulfur cluster-binding protein n=1 Tax=Bacillus sp. Marseille-P3661 TaxID=1936234 RepID=UPI000C84D349|nr:2Fe-2S iron-sulfur cluster-binding protein [Bacillus sp. Marseille-P3661]